MYPERSGLMCCGDLLIGVVLRAEEPGTDRCIQSRQNRCIADIRQEVFRELNFFQGFGTDSAVEDSRSRISALLDYIDIAAKPLRAVEYLFRTSPRTVTVNVAILQLACRLLCTAERDGQ